jgi:hypothetical protein
MYVMQENKAGMTMLTDTWVVKDNRIWTMET